MKRLKADDGGNDPSWLSASLVAVSLTRLKGPVVAELEGLVSRRPSQTCRAQQWYRENHRHQVNQTLTFTRVCLQQSRLVSYLVVFSEIAIPPRCSPMREAVLRTPLVPRQSGAEFVDPTRGSESPKKYNAKKETQCVSKLEMPSAGGSILLRFNRQKMKRIQIIIGNNYPSGGRKTEELRGAAPKPERVATPPTAQSAGAPPSFCLVQWLPACLPACSWCARLGVLGRRVSKAEAFICLVFTILALFFRSWTHCRSMHTQAARSVLGREIHDPRCWWEGR